MPASGNKFGAFNPQATDPYPIESTLAQGVLSNSPSLALPMLNTYQIQRQNQGQHYADELAAQHAFAQQELEETMRNNMAKNTAEFLGKPGGPGLIANAPGFTYLGGGASPEYLAGLAQTQERERQAKIFQEANAGLNSAGEAGYEYPTSGISYMTGLPVRQTTPRAIQVAGMHEAGANARQQGDKYTSSTTFRGADGQEHTISGKLRPGEDTQAKLNDIKLRNFGVQTSLPSAGKTTSTATPGATTATPAQNSTQGANAVQTQLEAALSSGQLGRNFSPGQIAAVKAGQKANGGRIAIGTAPSGNLVILDDKRQPIPGTEFRQ